ncbi:MAG TPA: hypothetical protein DCX06_06360 [Opitutae bacterium]|nr:hypothetical protein [Opitutae bacterium]
MGIKREKTCFYTNDYKCLHPFTSHQYSFIHPNSDTAENHISVTVLQIDGDILIKYKVLNNSSKGAKTYEFFDLEKIEIDSFDKLQGLDEVAISSDIPNKIYDEVEKNIEELER